MYAYCYADGVIGFGRKIAPRALRIACATVKKLEKAIHGTARLDYDNQTWLVPGIPEAETEMEGIAAYVRYRKEVERRLA